MRFSYSLLFNFSLIIALSSCSSTTFNIKNNIPFLDVNHHAFSEVITDNFRGQFYYNDGESYFQSCDNETQYPIRYSKKIEEIYETVTNDDDNELPVYIEFSGEMTFGNDFTNSVIINIDNIHHMALAKISLQCAKPIDNFSFKAKGNTPYWRLNLNEKELFFATKASNQSYTVEPNKFKTTPIQHFKSTNNKGEDLFLETKQEDCYMQDNKEYWGYRTKISSVHGEFIGCGEFGHISPSLPFKGEYISKSQAQEVNLTLNADHTIIYKQNNGTNEIVKTGFWKSNTDDMVVVMLAKQFDKKIQEELVFNRIGQTLISHEINQKNVITKFDNSIVFQLVNTPKEILENEILDIQRQFIKQQISPEKEIDLAVQAAVRQYFKIHNTDPEKTQFNSVRFDLNDDGYNEAIVLLDWCTGYECDMLIFEENEHGLNFSSRISHVQAPIIVSKNLHFSWQSLAIKSKEQWYQLDFDGTSYPLNSRNGKAIEEVENSAEVVLFSEGKPNRWFLIK
jgi:putative lipoprotein